jgi:hypothetical protein
MAINRTHGDFGERHEPSSGVEPAIEVGPAGVADTRWPGGVMVLLILAALGWPLVTLAASVPTYLIADREQGIVLAAVASAAVVLRWALDV